MFSTRGSSKNAKLGLVEKLLFEKNDISGQNSGQNRGKKSSAKNKFFASIRLKLEIFFYQQSNVSEDHEKFFGELQGITLVHIFWFKSRKLAKKRY